MWMYSRISLESPDLTRDDSTSLLECYHPPVRQLITRIDDALHARLKTRARDEGRSVNALVTTILEGAVPDETPREQLRRRLKAEGRLVELNAPEPTLSRDDVREMLRGDAGRAVLEALEEDRAER